MKKRITESDLRYKDYLIEKYFSRGLSFVEKQDFQKFVKNDLGFRARIEEELSFSDKLIRSVSGSSFASVPKTALAAVVVVAVGILLWFGSHFINTSYLQKSSPASPQKNSSPQIVPLQDNDLFEESVPDTPKQINLISDPMPTDPAKIAQRTEVVYASIAGQKEEELPEENNLLSAKLPTKPIALKNRPSDSAFRIENETIIPYDPHQYYSQGEGPVTLQLARQLAEITEDIRDIEELLKESNLNEDNVDPTIDRLLSSLLFKQQERNEILAALAVEEKKLEAKKNSLTSSENKVTTSTQRGKDHDKTDHVISSNTNSLEATSKRPYINPSLVDDQWRNLLEVNGIIADYADDQLDRKERLVNKYLNDIDQKSTTDGIRFLPSGEPELVTSPFSSRDVVLEIYVVADYFKQDKRFGKRFNLGFQKLTSLISKPNRSLAELQQVVRSLPNQQDALVKNNLLYLSGQLALMRNDRERAIEYFQSINSKTYLFFPNRLKLLLHLKE